MSLCALPELLLVRIPNDNTSVFHPRSWKYICALVLARPYSSDSYKAIFVFHPITTQACQLPAPTLLFIASLPQHAPLSLSLSLTHFNPRCGSLVYIFGLIDSWCSAPRLLLALTQTATNWEDGAMLLLYHKRAQEGEESGGEGGEEDSKKKKVERSFSERIRVKTGQGNSGSSILWELVTEYGHKLEPKDHERLRREPWVQVFLRIQPNLTNVVNPETTERAATEAEVEEENKVEVEEETEITEVGRVRVNWYIACWLIPVLLAMPMVKSSLISTWCRGELMVMMFDFNQPALYISRSKACLQVNCGVSYKRRLSKSPQCYNSPFPLRWLFPTSNSSPISRLCLIYPLLPTNFWSWKRALFPVIPLEGHRFNQVDIKSLKSAGSNLATTRKRKEHCQRPADSLRTPEFVRRVHGMMDENPGKSIRHLAKDLH
ncbi:hypothetical protein ACTXT7_004021 [Hymenolepis weldensis]